MFLEILAPRTQSPIAKIRFFAGTARKFLTFLLSLSLTVSEGTAKGPSQKILNARFSISDDLLPNANSYPTFRALSCPANETFDGWRVTALGASQTQHRVVERASGWVPLPREGKLERGGCQAGMIAMCSAEISTRPMGGRMR